MCGTLVSRPIVDGKVERRSMMQRRTKLVSGKYLLIAQEYFAYDMTNKYYTANEEWAIKFNTAISDLIGRLDS